MIYVEEPLGIPSSGYEYIEMPPNHLDIEAQLDEFDKIEDFLIEVANSNSVPEFQGKNKEIQFINYGKTELVYVLKVENRKYTILLGQPATEFGTVKKEYENLKMLGRNNKQNVIVPMQYFKNQESQKELYITPYVYQARCIGVDEKEWGIWIPEPEYHFREFNQKEREVINSSMIAMLIKLFNDKNNLGIGSCELVAGDFILEKEFEKEPITYENILRRMKLIAARELVSMSLDEYVNKLKEEFCESTYNKTEIINHKAKAKMSLEEVEKGIELGYELKRKEKETEICKNH